MLETNTFYLMSVGYLSSLLATVSIDSIGTVIGICGVISTTALSYLRYKLELKRSVSTVEETETNQQENKRGNS